MDSRRPPNQCHFPAWRTWTWATASDSPLCSTCHRSWLRSWWPRWLAWWRAPLPRHCASCCSHLPQPRCANSRCWLSCSSLVSCARSRSRVASRTLILLHYCPVRWKGRFCQIRYSFLTAMGQRERRSSSLYDNSSDSTECQYHCTPAFNSRPQMGSAHRQLSCFQRMAGPHSDCPWARGSWHLRRPVSVPILAPRSKGFPCWASEGSGWSCRTERRWLLGQ